jgi:lactate racemase
MQIAFRYGQEEINLELPDNSILYKSVYPENDESPAAMLLKSIEHPIGCPSLKEKIKDRKEGKVLIVVSDFTRPIPYALFLPELIQSLMSLGIVKEDILILVATGMHRPSTDFEKSAMFGDYIVRNFKIIDHQAENPSELTALPEKSWSGADVQINRHYFEAGFRIVTGLVEPHFMAGFSGGRKAICPGLLSLDAVTKFHGYEFLSHPHASTAVLENNPCHLENISVAKLCPADFNVNIILDQNKKVNSIISGDLFLSHEVAVQKVKANSCRPVSRLADLAITSSGGYPLDNTFYQCVKGFVNCLPALHKNAEIHAIANCAEGVGSEEYKNVMHTYSRNYKQFIEDIRSNDFFSKDQWQFQMHIRVLEKIGQENLHFYTSGIPLQKLEKLSVTPHYNITGDIGKKLQLVINNAASRNKIIAVFPEGPYCCPIMK